MVNRSDKNYIKRKAFIGWGMILGVIALLSITGMVIKPRVQAIYDTHKVKSLIEKENLIKQLFEVYYDNSNGDMTQVPQNIDALITRAKSDKLLPDDFDKSNGFGGDITFSLDGGLLRIGSTLPDDNLLVKNTYKSLVDKSIVSSSESMGGYNEHTYTLTGSIKSNTARLAAFTAKASESGAITNPNDVTKEEGKTKKWWDYDLKTNTYEIKSWDEASGSWKTDETKSFTGEVSNKVYTATTVSDIAANSVATGSKLYVNEDNTIKEYISYDGQWKAISSGTTIASGVNGEVEYNRLLEEEKAANSNVLTKAEADALSDKTNAEWWEYDTATSRYYVYRWSSDRNKWRVVEVNEINQFQETSIIAFLDPFTNKYTADVLSAIPAIKVDNGDGLDLVQLDGSKVAYLAIAGQWVAVEDNSMIMEDENGDIVLPFYKKTTYTQQVDQPNWKKVKFTLAGIGYDLRSDDGIVFVKRGTYVYNSNDAFVYKRLGVDFTADLTPQELVTGGIDYSTASWEKIGVGTTRLYIASGEDLPENYKQLSIEKIEQLVGTLGTTTYYAENVDTKTIFLNYDSAQNYVTLNNGATKNLVQASEGYFLIRTNTTRETVHGCLFGRSVASVKYHHGGGVYFYEKLGGTNGTNINTFNYYSNTAATTFYRYFFYNSFVKKFFICTDSAYTSCTQFDNVYGIGGIRFRVESGSSTSGSYSNNTYNAYAEPNVSLSETLAPNLITFKSWVSN